MFGRAYFAVLVFLLFGSLVYAFVALKLKIHSYETLGALMIGTVILFFVGPILPFLVEYWQERRERSREVMRGGASGRSGDARGYGGGARAGGAYWSSGGYDPGSGGGSSGSCSGGGYGGGGG
jgi:hypothetical protein